ncbi:autotransporter outer membrane beta-barrel domain-containing protein [Bartonella raoultii]|uniref:Autotransporter outer membrane beta-barrel domain-containing protein n=1 Tax=Bartonella raoultii TaxID=1457020 RepID=A0ABS7I3E7_9HYPH|nr:autotransporter outer membrane beta-barrel domain-containing protein [Bartonella raoultii]MBX4335193.1 autotransporter outer membrane beta-barrel domain-containing protein [Bartonella raoultii]
MIKISQYPFSLYRFTTVLFFLVHHVDAHESSSGKEFYSCSESASFYRCNDGQQHEISNKIYNVRDKSSGAAIEASGKDTLIEGQKIIVNGIANINAHSEESSWTTAIKASKKGGVSLSDSMLNNISIGAEVDEGGAFEMREGVIKATGMGVSAVGESSFVFLSDTTITTQSGAISLLSHGKAKIQMEKGKIDFSDGIGIQVAGEGEINLKNVAIMGRGQYGKRREQAVGNYNQRAAFSVLQGAGTLALEKGRVNVVNSHGIFLEGNDSKAVQIESSSFLVRNRGFHGMNFFWEGVFQGMGKIILSGKGEVQLKNTDFKVPESAALYSRKFESLIQLTEGSSVFGDLLLKAEEDAFVNITADASTLKGGAFMDQSATARIVLKNDSKWILLRPKYEKLQSFASTASLSSDYSSVSSLHLEKSSLVFERLKSIDTDNTMYQTLLVGKGKGSVYQAKDGAQLYLNSYLDKGGTLQEQKTDRLLINGDVLGETMVHVYSAPGSPGALTGEGGNNQGISIIQAYGTAKEDSFKLSGGYVTPYGSPYQYHLVAYGPSSSSGPADPAQKVLKDAQTFWDFRLESKFVASPSSSDVFPNITEIAGHPMDSDFETKTEVSGGETFLPPVTTSDFSSPPFGALPAADEPIPVGFFPSISPLVPPTSRSPDPTSSSSSVPASSTPHASDPITPSVPVLILPTSRAPEPTSSSPSVPVSSTPHSSDPTVHSSVPVLVSFSSRAPDPTSSSPSVPVSSTPHSSDPTVHSSVPVLVSFSSRAPDPTSSSPSVPVSSTPHSSDPTVHSSVPVLVSFSSRAPDPTSSSPSVPISSTPHSSDPTVHSSVPALVSSSSRFPDPTSSSPSVPVSSTPHASDPVTSSSLPVLVASVPHSSIETRVSLFAPMIPVSASVPHLKKSVRAVVPQVSTYLLLPNTLSHAGFLDISNQNKQLEMQRVFSQQLFKMDKNPALFLHGYSSNHRYSSNLSTLEYGYGGDVDYNAIEAGILLSLIENIYTTTSFGLMGTYGKLSLQPQNVEQSQESTFKKWTVTAYSSMQHNTGLYMDGLLSYGLFQGNVFTLKRGKTAALRGNPLSISLTAGKEFMLGCRGFIFDPQVQFVYQHLQFHETRDVDNFTIDMKKPDYWMMRIGGRLTKALMALEKSQGVSFYSKFHVIRDFSDKHHVYLGDNFLLGAFGSSFETGFGFSARLSPKIAFHSDLTYQYKLTKAGFSGTHFSGGLRYHF